MKTKSKAVVRRVKLKGKELDRYADFYATRGFSIVNKVEKEGGSVVVMSGEFTEGAI